MSGQPSRRSFLKTTATASLGFGSLQPFLALSPVMAQEARVTPELVRLSAEIEPIVRLIEETPQSKCIEVGPNSRSSHTSPISTARGEPLLACRRLGFIAE